MNPLIIPIIVIGGIILFIIVVGGILSNQERRGRR